MSALEHAISLAASAHAGYLADDEEPYIFHPLRVMLALADENERIVGVLHDVVEKTGWSLDNLRSEGFADNVLEAIDSVSRRHGEEYFDFVQRTRDNIAKVKSRLQNPAAREKLAKYEEALRRLS
jgi:(p)ppGpp synthase/HD superfamily hydrolase